MLAKEKPLFEKGKKNLQLHLKHSSKPPLERGRKKRKKITSFHSTPPNPTQETTLEKRGENLNPILPSFFF